MEIHEDKYFVDYLNQWNIYDLQNDDTECSFRAFLPVIWPSFPSSYVPERARSRSPISRSLSPHSHSPSFTSCSSAHSPQGAPCRGPERNSNGLGPRRGSWDWSSHVRRGEDERERDDPWRNGGGVEDDRPNGRAAVRRKAYQKPLDHVSSRSADEREGGGGGGGRGGGGEGMRGNRDWHPRGSPQGMPFSSYRKMEDEFYPKEHMYKSDKPPRPPYQRHDTKPKRRDGGDYHSRSRHSEYEITQEDKRQGSPGKDRSKTTSRRFISAGKNEKEKTPENTVSNFFLISFVIVYFAWHIFLAVKVFPFAGSQVKRQISFTSAKQCAKRVSWM